MAAASADHDRHRVRLETKAILIGYAMSRLDHRYLEARGCGSWKQAFRQASSALSVKPASLKNLRDEFDPVHPNARRGWHKRKLRLSRLRVLEELREVSDEALLELADKTIRGDDAATLDAIDALAVVTHVAHNIAERLLTGRRAEEFFLARCKAIVGIEPEELIDCREAARGYDFGVRPRPRMAIEVKGLKKSRGGILITDREWSEAKFRRKNYFLVVVGNLSRQPRAIVISDPIKRLKATCRHQTSITATWHSTVSVA